MHKKSLAIHVKGVHKAQNVVVNLIRPVRVAAKRANERLCILRNEVMGVEDAEWLLESEIDSTVLSMFLELDENDQSDDTMTEVDDIRKWLTTPWSNHAI